MWYIVTSALGERAAEGYMFDSSLVNSGVLRQPVLHSETQSEFLFEPKVQQCRLAPGIVVSLPSKIFLCSPFGVESSQEHIDTFIFLDWAVCTVLMLKWLSLLELKVTVLHCFRELFLLPVSSSVLCASLSSLSVRSFSFSAGHLSSLCLISR